MNFFDLCVKYSGIVALVLSLSSLIWQILQYKLKNKDDYTLKHVEFFRNILYNDIIEKYIGKPFLDGYMELNNIDFTSKKTLTNGIYQFQSVLSDTQKYILVLRPLDEKRVDSLSKFLEEQEDEIVHCITSIFNTNNGADRSQLDHLYLRGIMYFYAKLGDIVGNIKKRNIKELAISKMTS